MRILDRRIWVGLSILAAVALVSSAAVLGGIEWAFASLGALVLIGIIGIGINTLVKTLGYSASFNGNDLQYAAYSKLAKAGPVSKVDKRIIMKHIDGLFSMGQEQSVKKLAKAEPISKEDKRIIMRHIDELFSTGSKRM